MKQPLFFKICQSISVKHLITSPHDSVVLVDKHRKPTGFLSIRDVLQAITFLQSEENVLLIIKRPSKAVSNKELKQATNYLELFAKKLKKRMKIEKIEVTSKEVKNPNGDTKIFNSTVIFTPVAGKSLVVVTKNRNFFDGIQEATKSIEKLRRRSGLSKRETSKS